MCVKVVRMRIFDVHYLTYKADILHYRYISPEYIIYDGDALRICRQKHLDTNRMVMFLTLRGSP